MPVTLAPPERIASAGLARWGLYGVNGAGKSTFAATVPREIPTLVVSADEENVKPYRGHAHIYVAKITEWEDLADILLMFQSPATSRLFAQALRDMASDPIRREYAQKRWAEPAVKSGKEPFWQAVVFDTWTRMQALAINMNLGYKLIKPGQEAEFITRIPKTPKGWDAWQQAGALLSEWMRYFNRLPVHTLSLMQEEIRRPKEEMADYDSVAVGPALTPSAANDVKTVLELVGRLYVETQDETPVESNDPLAVLPPARTSPRDINPHAKEVRKVLLGKHDLYFAKGPTHLLGYVVENPTWPVLARSLVITEEVA